MDVQDGPRARVLIVDDDGANLVVLLEMLLAEGMSPTAVASGAEALELLAHARFDVVLLDIHMPQLDGAEVLARLRAQPGPNRDVPVVAVTADTYTRLYDDYLRLGFFELLTKPVTIDKIAACVRRAHLMRLSAGGGETQPLRPRPAARAVRPVPGSG